MGRSERRIPPARRHRDGGGCALPKAKGIVFDVSVRTLAPSPKVLTHSDRVVLAPRAVRAEPGRSQRLIARSESLDDWMSREPHLKPLRQVISHAPRVLHANPTPRPGVEILRHILAKKERRIEESHESAKPSLAERPQLDRPPDHVARKRAAL